MKADGLYTLDGNPADEDDSRHPNRPRVKINRNGVEINDDDDNIRIDENGVRIKRNT
jgi:hypothetical protein